MSAEAKLKEMGLTLPPTPKPLANYVPFKRIGDLVFLSGQGPRYPDGSFARGKVGRDVTVEQAYEHAKMVGLGLLSVAKAAAGSLDKVEMLKLLGMVNGVPEFTDQPKVSMAARISSWRCSARMAATPARRSAWARCPRTSPSRSRW